jgi:hypothetical protein
MRDNGWGRRTGSIGRGVWAALLGAALLASCGGDEEGTGSDPAVTTIARPGATTTTAPAQVEKAKPAPGTANVQGKVLYDDQPVPGIEVKLCETFSRFGSGCSGAELKATTGADGEYVITNVPPKEYQALLVRVFDTDSYQFAQSGVVSAKAYVAEADRTLFVDTSHLYKSDLALREPASGSTVAATGVKVSWDAYPSAAHYELTLQPETDTTPVNNQRVDGTSYVVPAPLRAGTYRVTIEAFNAKGRKLAEGPKGYSFTVSG